jgi:tetratricopeptide (TPR) repeat protein
MSQAIQQGITLINQGDYDKAIELLTQALSDNSHAPTVYMYRGTARRLKGEHEQALIDLTYAIELSHHFFPEAYRQRGLVYQAIGETARARSDFCIALSDRGLELAKKGDLLHAIEYYTRAIKILPSFAPPYNNRANAYLKQRNLDGALADLSKAIELKPDYEEAYSNRGAIYLDRKQYQEALNDCTTAIHIRPLYAPAYNNRALVYRAMDRFEDALRDSTTAIALKPDYTEAYANRGIIHLMLHHLEDALADLENAIERGLDPRPVEDILLGLRSLIYPQTSPADPLVEQGIAYLRLSQLDQAESILLQALETSPQDIRAHHHLGNLYRLRGRYSQAVEHYSLAISLDPQHVDSYLGRGIAYLEQEIPHYEAAIGDLSCVLELQPDMLVVYRLRGIAYLQVGDIPAAIADLQTYLDRGGGAVNGDGEQIAGMVEALKKQVVADSVAVG